MLTSKRTPFFYLFVLIAFVSTTSFACNKKQPTLLHSFDYNEKLHTSGHCEQILALLSDTKVSNENHSDAINKIFEMHKMILTPSFQYKFQHGPTLKYGLSLKKHAMRLKFQVIV